MQGLGTLEQSTSFNPLLANPMKTILLEQTRPETKALQFCGIDVGADEWVMVIRKHGKPSPPQTTANTPAGHAQLAKKLSNLPGVIVCMEATGTYPLDLSIARHDAGIALRVVNPKAAHNFARP